MLRAPGAPCSACHPLGQQGLSPVRSHCTWLLCGDRTSGGLGPEPGWASCIWEDAASADSSWSCSTEGTRL